MDTAMEGRTPEQEIADRRLSPRKTPSRIDAAELQRFTELLNGDLLVEPPPADHFLRWTPARTDPGVAGQPSGEPPDAEPRDDPAPFGAGSAQDAEP
jgi:hypothetical protein